MARSSGISPHYVLGLFPIGSIAEQIVIFTMGSKWPEFLLHLEKNKMKFLHHKHNFFILKLRKKLLLSQVRSATP